MHISCLEVNSNSDINILDLCLDTSFSVEAAACGPVDERVINTIDAYYNNDVSFEEITKSIRHFSNSNADFIILTHRQIQSLDLSGEAIVVGKAGQQIYLLDFNSDSLRKVLYYV